MIKTYKIFHGFVDTGPSKLFKINQNKTRGHKYKIVLNKYRLDARINFYSQQIVKEWTCLPVNIVEAKDVITFEELFDKIMMIKIMMKTIMINVGKGAGRPRPI